MKGTQFTVEEKQLIVEALLFSSSVDVCAEWTPKQNALMVDIAKRLNETEIKLNTVYLFEGGMFDDEQLANQLIKDFPNLPRSSVITD